MKSIYDMMGKGNVQDESGKYYPDPLAIDLTAINITTPLENANVNRRICKRPYIITAEAYGIDYLDDLFWWLNRIPSSKHITPNTKIQIPSYSDINNFYRNGVVKDGD